MTTKNKRYRVLPYKQGSRSAKELASALDGKVLKLEGSKFSKRPSDLVIRWGQPDSVASNKLKFFQLLKEQHPTLVPPFWTSQQEIPDDAFPVLCRTVLAGHSGAGIVVAESRAKLVAAPLYVKYVPKKDEYRVHLGRVKSGGEVDDAGVPLPDTRVIAVQRKARDTSNPSPNWKVRSHANGFNFIRNGVDPPAPVLEGAVQAFRCSGLDFGAVDVIWNEKGKKAYVLEINTAPGLEGQTIEDYANFFKDSIL